MKKIELYIPVTQPYLPPLEEFIPYLQEIWNSKQLTNNGPMHCQLEHELSKYLGVSHISLFNNGTSALLTALQAMNIEGEVITTPYSFVATTNSIIWNKLTPVFVDIEPCTFNIDPKKIESAITSKTSAILPVHCYGNPCDVEAIQTIANKYNLKVIYDAAHAFAVNDRGGSILRYGDLSILSFHATKVFNTFEGGAIICHTQEMKNHIDLLKNFGIADELTVSNVGINGKMCEVSAAFGLLQLRHMDSILERRRNIDQLYRKKLNNVRGIIVSQHSNNVEYNYSYFPILVTDKYPISRDALYEKLKQYGIYGRRYFFPLISNFSSYEYLESAAKENLKNSNIISTQVLCLPIFPELDFEIVEWIAQIIADV